MHFRFRGNNIQVVKSQFDQDIGKAKSVPIGSINLANLTVTDKLRASCSADELEEIEAWVKHYHGVEELKRKHAALTLPEQIAAATRWFNEAGADEARQIADDVLTASTMLRRVLTKRGLL
jgi:hypothetical protein